MPIFDYFCTECGRVSEILMTGSDDKAACSHCGGDKVKKLMAAPSSLSGASRNAMPGPGDTACCGSHPGEAAGCAGPGTCCGRAAAFR